MTNRLKILSLGLVLSLIVAVADYSARDDKRPRPRVKTKAQVENSKRKTKRTKITKQKTIILMFQKFENESIFTISVETIRILLFLLFQLSIRLKSRTTNNGYGAEGPVATCYISY